MPKPGGLNKESLSVSRAFLIAFCAGSFALAGVMMLFLPEADG
jgi:hypothetical protein